MSTLASPVVVQETPVAATPAPAPKLNALQIAEQELVSFFKQKEQAIANVHAIEGAIQGTQRLIQLFRSAAAKVEVKVEEVASEVKTEIEKVATEVVDEAKKL